MQKKKHRILFLVTEDWYFCSHRLPLAEAAKANGYDVSVATRVGAMGSAITDAGLKLIPLQQLRRSSLNPLQEVLACFELLKIYRAERPTLVHHVALKPVIYGSIAARLARVPFTVNALAGLGFVFSSRKPLARLLRPLLTSLLRCLLNGFRSRLIVQNRDDQDVLIGANLIDPTCVHLIRGVGVDLNAYAPRPSLNVGPPLVILASRMLWDKGIGEFADAARILKERGRQIRFALVGETDADNPTSVPHAQLEAWRNEGVIEWWGYRRDMPEVLVQADIVCLPTYYGEGVPKVLIEAMACAKPIVTTDTPGCRDLVQDGVNGRLVPARDASILAEAIDELLSDAEARHSMGTENRRRAVTEFSMERSIGETLSIYSQLLEKR